MSVEEFLDLYDSFGVAKSEIMNYFDVVVGTYEDKNGKIFKKHILASEDEFIN